MQSTYFEPRAVPADPDLTVSDLLVERVRETPDLPLFAVPDGDGWRDITAAEFHAQVVALAKGFVAAGLPLHAKIGLLAKTRYEWTLIDFAVWTAGCVLVPVYETSSPAQIQWILSDSGAEAVILESAEHFTRFDEVHPDLPGIGTVWQLDRNDLDKLISAGASVTDEELEKRRTSIKGDDLGTLIYTAGSTGRPKGVVLTQSNFAELSRNTRVAVPEVFEGGGSTVLFITLAHVFARFISVISVDAGVKVGHQADTSQLLPALASFKPTFLLAVPRVFEKVYNSAEQKAEAGGRGRIFRAAADAAVQYSKALDAGRVPFGLRIRFALFDRLVLSKLREALGGRVKYAVSGSAPLGLRLGHFFRALGIGVMEGYGLTETTAPVTVNRPTKFKIGTVGPALPGVGIAIADDGEVLIKGIPVFREYWNNPTETAKAFTEDGWFRTGDLGSIDDEGYLSITGRSKEIIVTAGGKNVAPATLEDPIRANPLVSQIVVVGDRKPFISALITLDSEMLPTWLKNRGENEAMTMAEAAQHPLVLAELQRAVDAANERVSRAESIRKFVVLDHDFTESAGHTTPKFSIRRHAILEDYKQVIETLYATTPATRGISISH